MTDTPIETGADAWRDDADIADDDFFAPLRRNEASRPEGDYRFQGPQGRYNLTWRQEAFARHYAACGNGAEAARRAGYSVASARFIAYENLQDSRIRWRIRAIADRREARRRAESAYVIRMLNAAMEMALRQELPNTMIRALAHMARLGGLDRPAAAPPSMQDDDEDSRLETEAARALLPADAAGVLQEAVLDADNHSEPPRDDTERTTEASWSPDRLAASGVVSEQTYHPGRARGPSRGPVEADGVLRRAVLDGPDQGAAQDNPLPPAGEGGRTEGPAGWGAERSEAGEPEGAMSNAPCGAPSKCGRNEGGNANPHPPTSLGDAGPSLSRRREREVSSPVGEAFEADPDIPRHSPTSGKFRGEAPAPARLAAEGAAGRLRAATQGETAGPPGGEPWSS